MDEKSLKFLEGILAKEPDALSPEEVGFLKARREYLTSEQQQKYASVLGDAPVAPVTPEQVQQTVEQPAEPAAPAQPENPQPDNSNSESAGEGPKDPYDPDA